MDKLPLVYKGWNIVAAFRGMHVLPAKHSYAWLPRKCDYRRDTRTDKQTDAGQSDPYLPLCFAGNTINYPLQKMDKLPLVYKGWINYP